MKRCKGLVRTAFPTFGIIAFWSRCEQCEGFSKEPNTPVIPLKTIDNFLEGCTDV
jgi:hypothetical protein